jgi:hypothetical protein
MAGGVPRDDIQAHLEAEFRHMIPDDQLLASHSINRGVPLVMSHRRSAVARAIRDLARRLVQALGTEETVAEESPAGAPVVRSPRRAAANPGRGAAGVIRNHAVSISLFGLAVILLVVIWFLSGRLLTGLLVGLVPVLVGIFLYRRGK